MESISKILDAISAQSLAETDKIMESSRQEAEELQKLYEKEALKARDNILSKANAEADGIRQRNLSQAGIESRNLLLSARREAIEKVFAKAAERLASMPDTEKKALYEKLISRYSGSDEVIVQLNSNDKDKLGRKIKPDGVKMTIDKENGDFSGGLIIKEKTTETNCTFEVMVENAKKEMVSEVAAMLFSADTGR
ncbi:MAG: V-type ATP synthase subunit E [Clostridiales bacterium]|nr:V-type ATP synthase subunit E [Clostridiales bacterium]